MSFSSDVKEELFKKIPQGRHCKIAEISAIIGMCGRIQISSNNRLRIRIHTENSVVARKYFTLLKKTYNIETVVSVRQSNKQSIYTITTIYHEDAVIVLQGSKLLDKYGNVREDLSIEDGLLVQKECCKRAYIRGSFLAGGSIIDPNKFYHLELVCNTQYKAEQLKKMISYFNINAKIVERKGHYVVYIKEGSDVVDTLSVMEAPVSLMNLENVMILKDMRNSVNRRVNCETANLNKTVSAAVKQIEDIKYIRDTVGLSKLSNNLQEIAKLRLENGDASLKELGEMLDPKVGKSGVNHRLRKISEIADGLRSK
ncbi:MAG: DNA-binding protein WhiA [Lachnospiraceae bacterium]|nr:DNA-binding protein WhiA [Lachnospiraceae bacterium]